MDTVQVVETVNEAELAAVRTLLAAAAESDGRTAVSEQGRLALRGPKPGVRHLLQWDSGALVGYAQVDGPGTAELAVDPARRRQGHGRELAEAAVRAGAVQAWAHGGHPGARRLAEQLGFELVRELRQMRRPLPAVEADAEIPLPEGVRLRTFRPGADDRAWLALNAAAFAHHPEQGGWTAQDLADRLAEPWFDPAGFFLAVRGDEPVGFHWTKVEGGVGEVYVVGVGPAEQGNGLGRALTSVGLRYLGRDRGLDTVLLYVDADNPAAVRVYEKLGFTVYEVDLMYRSTGPR
ncbi:mycothiol synthase [Streptacidiphilus carbonis]|uniref:mycothiol synthase n=1 Tax=Streptacidiphilus carbonis TaxID=105422 RepID=UPI0005AABEE4|nr:mycothiol synthase [Streptacidiphilus carbonis]